MRKSLTVKMVREYRNSFMLFVLAQCLAFSCIALLQVVHSKGFIPLLLVMHVGIAFFIVSKKRFLKTRSDLKVHYRISYACLALFLPILFYRLVSDVFFSNMNEKLVFTLTIIALTISVGVGLANTLYLKRSLQT